MDDALVETEAVTDDQSWLGGASGTSSCRSITLDLSTFVEADDYPDGFIRSGVALRPKNADGLTEKYDGPEANNEVQTITRTATGGTVDGTFDGDAVAGVAIVGATTAAQVQEFLEDFDGIDPGDVDVEGAAGGPFVIEFVGKFAGRDDVPLLAIDDDDATGGTVLVARTTPGGSTGFAGHLFTPVRVRAGATVASGALFWGPGSVIEANLPPNNGLDAAAKAAAKFIDYR